MMRSPNQLFNNMIIQKASSNEGDKKIGKEILRGTNTKSQIVKTNVFLAGISFAILQIQCTHHLRKQKLNLI